MNLKKLILGLQLLSSVGAQKNRFTDQTPASEKEALKKIVEDTPPPPQSAQRKGSKWESPEYKQIYANPLPIPPVKQPKQWVKASSTVDLKEELV